MTKDHPSLFDAISTVIVIGMIIGLLNRDAPRLTQSMSHEAAIGWVKVAERISAACGPL